MTVFLVTGTTTAFGTAFFVGRDAKNRAYVVTCAHVVRDVGGPEAVTVGGRRATLVAMGSPEGADDVAVLEADVPPDARPLQVGRATSGRCHVTGYRKLYGEVREARRIQGEFADVMLTSAGRSSAAWHLIMAEAVPEGYSGSPVVDTRTGQVVGIASLSVGVTNGAVAVAADELRALWPEITGLSTPSLTVRNVEFVYVPPGTFLMGTPERRAGELAVRRQRPEFTNESPQTEITVQGLYLARHPVTNAQYQEFVDDTGTSVSYRHTDPWSSRYSWDPVTRRFPLGLDRHPVVMVSWTQAWRYCTWLQARLPTEAEWERAARGGDGRAWPWGDEWQQHGNTIELGRGALTPAGTHSPEGDSPFGAADMCGNVWEWCSSLADPYPYRADDGREDRGAEGRRVLRGGAFEQDRYLARCATRNSARQDDFGFTIGFRPALRP